MTNTTTNPIPDSPADILEFLDRRVEAARIRVAEVRQTLATAEGRLAEAQETRQAGERHLQERAGR